MTYKAYASNKIYQQNKMRVDTGSQHPLPLRKALSSKLKMWKLLPNLKEWFQCSILWLHVHAVPLK